MRTPSLLFAAVYRDLRADGECAIQTRGLSFDLSLPFNTSAGQLFPAHKAGCGEEICHNHAGVLKKIPPSRRLDADKPGRSA